MILAGIFTRWTALLGVIMMAVYIALIASAWIRNLPIDCGCFTQGGWLAAGQKTKFLQDILRDLGFAACGVWIVIKPKSPFTVDAWIAGPTT